MIVAMLSVNNDGLSKSTIDWLDYCCKEKDWEDRLPVYKRDDNYGYGWFIPVKDYQYYDHMPTDLWPIIQLATRKKCKWIAIERKSFNIR